ncbi:MAG: peptidoglycan binding domain-containing protein [Anaerolineales bacterium]
MKTWIKWAVIGVVVLLIVGAGALLLYTDPGERIYPGVSVEGIDVGGMTREEAEAALRTSLPNPAEEGIVLQAEGRAWRYSWEVLGRGYDYAATVDGAYAVGRQGSWLQQRIASWKIRSSGWRVDPVVVAADEARIRAAVERIASEVDREPQDAQLSITPQGAEVTPAGEGRRLNLETNVAAVSGALAEERREVALAVGVLAPRISEPEPARSQAERLLSRPLLLNADDPLTGYEGEIVVPAERLAAWLRPVARPDAAVPEVVLQIDRAAVRSWLEETALQLGEERILDVEETLDRLVGALEAGEEGVYARIRHPQKRYYVEPGDTFFDIAYNHGFPQWRLEETNPDVDPEGLLIGQELVIPSIDVLVPEPVVPGKRIEINLPEQKLRAFENGELVYEFTVSSGMSRTPTIQGQFQVLMKEPDAFAQRWSLDMPFFMGIYKEGPDFYNGIHELPINAGGYRLSSGVLGWPASFGCIILDEGEAQALYDWAPVGTLVRIQGVAPGTPTWTETLDRIVDNPP